MYIKLGHMLVQLKLTQGCKSTVLQYRIRSLKTHLTLCVCLFQSHQYLLITLRTSFPTLKSVPGCVPTKAVPGRAHHHMITPPHLILRHLLRTSVDQASTVWKSLHPPSPLYLSFLGHHHLLYLQYITGMLISFFCFILVAYSE